jgi:hypothetical protein
LENLKGKNMKSKKIVRSKEKAKTQKPKLKGEK